MNNVVDISNHPKYPGFNYAPHILDARRSTALVHACGSVAFNVKVAPSGKVELICAKCNERLELEMRVVGEQNVAEPHDNGPQAA